jgi:hypothetical protein
MASASLMYLLSICRIDAVWLVTALGCAGDTATLNHSPESCLHRAPAGRGSPGSPPPSRSPCCWSLCRSRCPAFSSRSAIHWIASRTKMRRDNYKREENNCLGPFFLFNIIPLTHKHRHKLPLICPLSSRADRGPALPRCLRQHAASSSLETGDTVWFELIPSGNTFGCPVLFIMPPFPTL